MPSNLVYKGGTTGPEWVLMNLDISPCTHGHGRRGDEYEQQKGRLGLDIGEKFTLKMVQHRRPEV